MNPLNPRLVRIIFIASVVMVTLSLILSAVSVATVLSAPQRSTVSVPNLVGFEGFLADASGNPIADGTYSVTFRIFDVASGGTALWTETQSTAQVTKGLYAVTLGSVTALPTGIFNGNRWIGVTVGTGSEMTPRTRVAAVPFALNADSANNVAGASLGGMIALFDTACPSGWTEVTSVRGRVVVGVPSGGTVSGTIGTALTNLEDRTHTHTGPSHTHRQNTAGTSSSKGLGSTIQTDGGVGSQMFVHTSGSITVTYMAEGVQAAGTGATGTASTSNVIPYIQLNYCKFSP